MASKQQKGNVAEGQKRRPPHDNFGMELSKSDFEGIYCPPFLLEQWRDLPTGFTDPEPECVQAILYRRAKLGIGKVGAVAVPPKRQRRSFLPPQIKAKSKFKAYVKAMEWLSDRHFVVNIAGKTWVANMPDPADPEDQLTFSSFGAFKDRYLNWYVSGSEPRINEEGKTEDGSYCFQPAPQWLESGFRRDKSNVILDPSPKADPYAYNLWQGFGVVPRCGPWPTIEWHLRNVICAGNEAHYRWLVQWLAYGVQNPAKPAEVAVVLKGKKGTGKGMLFRLLQRIYGSHSFHASSPEHFLSRFNGHLMKTLLLCIDEGFWGGDKRNEGKLKAMITEEKIAFEAKYQPTVMMPNRLRLLMAGNEKWQVPATHDERRYLVLEVSDCMQQNTAYFKRMMAAIDGPETAAFLQFLMKLDLSAFDHRNPPHTAALDEQKQQSLEGFPAFWFDCLYKGCIGGDDDLTWPSSIPIKHLHKHYTEWKGRGARHPVSSAEMGTELHRLCPDVDKKRPAAKKKKGPKVPAGKGPRAGSRPEVYILPSLETARTQFLEAMKIEHIEWPAGHDTDWPAEQRQLAAWEAEAADL